MLVASVGLGEIYKDLLIDWRVMIQSHNTEEHPVNAALFGRLLQEVTVLSTQGAAGLQSALEQIRAYFCYGSAFIYELEPSKGVVLQEHVEMFERNELPASFSPEQVFTKEQLDTIAKNPLYCTDIVIPGDKLISTLSELFDAKCIFVIFILDEKKSVIGCVGMVDIRTHAILSDEMIGLVNSALLPIAEKARFRVYKRRLDYTAGTLESIMDHIGFDIYVNDFTTHEMLYANKSMAEPYGGWKSMQGKKCFKALYDDKDDECPYCPKKHLIDDEGNPSKIYSWDYQRPFDGRWFRVISAAFQWTDGRLAHVISSTDINEAKENELLIQKMAYYDILTDIPNRRKLETDLNELIELHKVDHKPVAVLFLDLDGFKTINDHYGHSGGDVLLKHVSQVFSENELTAKRSYRYGGDEFIFLFDSVSDEEIEEHKRAILELLQTPFELEGDILSCRGSIGAACYPRDGATYWELLDRADDAMYRNKQRSKFAQDSTD